ncbi:PilZ domain-containing protein [Lysinibacillus yapensis]|uniref:PilZ domain-containing protein n=1 Tax=Ureibacillus yapensis TaxID=2304605 RepID=A0A396STV8_9BACL|nr:PilZ domain-containing protein [Lysinibacillus yapensis]RHW39921.1 PilZ domain-containing protein [Lysinibacillus yapensis]
MQFKRKEGFRYVFKEPIKANVRLLLDGVAINPHTPYSSEILDISPRGVKLFSEAKIGEYLNNLNLQMELQFVLDVKLIEAIGEIMWVNPYMNGQQYGLSLHAQEDIDKLIISEMKFRRKKEMLLSKRR